MCDRKVHLLIVKDEKRIPRTKILRKDAETEERDRGDFKKRRGVDDILRQVCLERRSSCNDRLGGEFEGGEGYKDAKNDR